MRKSVLPSLSRCVIGTISVAVVMCGLTNQAAGQIAYTGASRFVAVTGFGFLTSSDLDPFNATLGDVGQTFASQSSELAFDSIVAGGASADPENAGMSLCTVDFDLADVTAYEMRVSLFGEGSIARLLRLDGNDEIVLNALQGSNQLIIVSFNAGVLEAGSYRFELGTQGGPAIAEATPWNYQGTFTVPSPAALPLVGLLACRRRRHG